MKLKKLIRRLFLLLIVVVVAIFAIDFFLDDEDYSDSDYSLSMNDYDNQDNSYPDDDYSNSEDYDNDSWSVLDFLLSFIDDDEYYNYDSGRYDDYDQDVEIDYVSANGNNNGTVTETKPVVTESQEKPKSISTQRKKFIEYALSLKGTPYVWGGKTPSPGLDCSGLIAFAARKAISVNYTGNAQSMYDNGKYVSMDSAEPGDLLFFSDKGTGITHVGIYLGRDSGQGNKDQRLFVHSASDGANTGVIVSSLDQVNYWSKHFVGAKSFLTTTQDNRKTRGINNSNSSNHQEFELDSWWNDVDPSWFDD